MKLYLGVGHKVLEPGVCFVRFVSSDLATADKWLAQPQLDWEYRRVWEVEAKEVICSLTEQEKE